MSYEKRQQDIAVARLDCRIDSLQMLLIMLEQQINLCLYDAIPLDAIPGRQLRTAHTIIDSIRGSMDRMDKLFADPAVAEPVRLMEAAE
jgi:hypothetical protein